MFKHAALLLTVLLVLSSCSDEATNPGTITVVPPKAGSTFTFDDYDTDTTSGAIIADSRDTSVHTVVSAGITFQGKSNVSEFSVIESEDTSAAYLNYETNGDISLYMPGFSDTVFWLVFPISTRTTFSVVLSDTTVTLFGITMQTTVTGENSYVGTETVTVAGQALSAIKIKQSIKTKITGIGVAEENSMDTFFYFAPSLGYVVKVDRPVGTIPGLNTKTEGSMSLLISYDLK